MWTPLRPQRSGIADYSHALLTELAQLTDTVATKPSALPAHTDAPVALLDATEACRADDINIYQIGNDAQFHAEIYQHALSEPGIVVLHDTSLLDFALAHYGGIDSPEFEAEVEHCHGPVRTVPSDPATVNGYPATPIDGIVTLNRHVLRMERRLVENSKAVIVHDPWSAAMLRSRYPNSRIHVVPHGVSQQQASDRTVRASLGWAQHHLVFGVFGGFGRNKRITVAVLAFAALRARWPAARLIIAGHPDDYSVVTATRQLIDELGIAGSVQLKLAPDADEFADLIAAVDTVISLRWPTAGETSGVVMQALSAGKPVITSDLPQYRHLDAEFCWRVDTDEQHETNQLIRILEYVARSPTQVRHAGLRARQYIQQNANWASVAQQYRDICESVHTIEAPVGSPIHTEHNGVGANVFADPRATTGLAESARRHITALLEVGAELTLTEFNTGAPNHSVPLSPEFAALRGGKEYPVDLWFVNINEFQRVPDSMLDRYTIGIWAWELPTLPAHAKPQLSRVDELWVVSEFAADACRTATDRPVKVIPCVVPQQPVMTGDRTTLTLPTSGLLVLFTFSAASSDARKNPWAAISAFAQAFEAAERGRTVHLVVKVNELHRFPELASQLQQRIAEVNGTLITDELTRSEMDGLLAACDIYLSLHRSEGFGLGMAEAMAMGKAVIATGFGGNTDFMPPGTAELVGYRARPITTTDHQYGREFADWYEPGQLWADADTTQAARWLRKLADDRQLRRAMGRRAADLMQNEFGYHAIGYRMLQRIKEITSSLSS